MGTLASANGLSGYNERKFSVLDALDELGEADSFQVWDHLDEDVSLEAIQMALSRYYKMGLVGRTRKPDRVYFLTEKGFERLNFLLESEWILKVIPINSNFIIRILWNFRFFYGILMEFQFGDFRVI